MGFLSKIIGTGAGKAAAEIGEAADSLFTSAEERNAAKAEAMKAVVDAQVRMVEAEAASGGLAAIWRPIASLSFTALVWWIVVAATFGYAVPDLSRVPAELWQFLMGYGVVRSGEKIGNLFLSRKQIKARRKAREE